MANSNNDKTLKELKKEFDEKIAKAKYANSIKAECYFYETSTAEYDSRTNNSLLSLSKNKPPIECTILTNGLSVTDYAFITYALCLNDNCYFHLSYCFIPCLSGR